MFINKDLCRFLVVGIGSNLMNFGVYLLIHSMGISLFSASVAGYSAGLIVSYHFGRVWVFGGKFKISKQNIIRFFIVYAVGGLGMSVLIEQLDRVTNLDYRICWFFGAIFAVINNFIGQKWLVFNRREKNNGN
ncbi:MAG: GtrA family protein [Methylococcaceae bacterium]